jgi:pentose-5-phosphate-3-epimerase
MPVLAAINKHIGKTIDVHLMIVDPDRYIKTFQYYIKHTKRTLKRVHITQNLQLKAEG